VGLLEKNAFLARLYEQYLFGAIFHQPVLDIECGVFLLRRRPVAAVIGLYDARADVVRKS
jgi:hypothetical protein